MSSKDETLELVEKAIDNISNIHRAHNLLRRLSRNSESVRDFLAEELLTTESEVYSSNSESEDEAAYRPSKRRRIPYAHVRYQKCAQCLEEFDITDNTTGCCTWHEGELELDYEADTWIDWDEYAHGPRDTLQHREEYPDGFTWTCCDEPGDAEGCESGRHSTVHGEPPQKRKRYEYEELREHTGTPLSFHHSCNMTLVSANVLDRHT
ncbi:uncharacterized protein BDZ99DRAFT_565250 [Mytilinidion resinicola]|uniref:C2H2-type domain-containing protein n=1 Tax=Mytilinidion resinicola TaxID=574789 RepID=A0A6A6Z923_9PEZI|nr:uncharacterized protein BDZ99DRAFT_565250 [Mytilinidion resinicola]KAF2817516.1 hypothetical protein BDZ99DRAFT_565250 [Mytilinidion resinicola]